jgi:hypothetical protein
MQYISLSLNYLEMIEFWKNIEHKYIVDYCLLFIMYIMLLKFILLNVYTISMT